MTLGGGSAHTHQSESLMLAYNKRKAQLERWKDSDTERETMEIRNRPKRVKFADKCIFQAACASNDKNQVAKMIQDGYDINAVDEDGITALHQACIEDNLDMVEFLLTHGADVNISDNEGWTPLHAVATCCYVSIAKVLLEHGANVVALNNDCSIPLDICKSDEIREIFIQDINAKGIDLKEARRGEELTMLEDAKRWISQGYSEDSHPTTGATALHVAACKGYIKVLDLLIKAGANINIKDFDGWTPLHAAAHWGQKEACEILLESNCDTSVKNNCDQTALDVADDSVFPVFENFKRKRDVNKNLEKVPNNLPNTHSRPISQPKKQLPRDEDIQIIPDRTGYKDTIDDTSMTIPEPRKSTKLPAEDSSKHEDVEAAVSPSEPSSSPGNDSSVSVKPGKTVDSNANSDESGACKRSGSLRTRNSSQVEETKNPDKTLVKRSKGDPSADTSLRRAYSFESDSKFYTKLRDAKNRIKASDLSLSPFVTNPSLAIQENPTSPPSKLIPTTDSEPALILADVDQANSSNLANSNNHSPLTISKLDKSLEESVLTLFSHRRNKDMDSSPNVAGSPNLTNRPVGSQDVKVRSDGNATTAVFGGAKIPGPVSKFKQFLFKSFVPPTRDEESETQRKAHAKRVRETRRSTQGVTLEELKSAEQYVKNSLLANPSTNELNNSSVTSSVPAPSSVPRKDDEASVERRPSWRLRVDETDPSKFSLEDTRSVPVASPSRSGNNGDNLSVIVQRSPSVRTRVSVTQKSDDILHAKPPKPPEDSEKRSPGDDDKDKDMKNSGAQGAILRKKKTKRRSTGIVQYSHDGTEIVQANTGSDAEVGSGPSSDIDLGDSSRGENGVSSINYRKLYEEVLKENQLLKARLSKSEEDIGDLKTKLERVSLTPRISSDDLERREKKALERKLSEMEEELKEARNLRTENQKLKDENGALIRVISKLSK